MTTITPPVYPLLLFHGVYSDGRVTNIYRERAGADLSVKLIDADGHVSASPYTYPSLLAAQIAAGTFWDDYQARKLTEESAGVLPVDVAPIAERKGLA